MRSATVYGLAALAGIALFLVCSAIALEQRGYWAIGGEYLMLTIPAWVWMLRNMKEE